jgi:hypothetical protein
MRPYAWLLLVSTLPLATLALTARGIDATSDAAVVASLDRMIALMSPEEQRAFHQDIYTALAQDDPGAMRPRCGLGSMQMLHGEFYPVAELVRPLHGRTVAEIRAQAAAVREEAARLEAERVLLQAEADQLRPRNESFLTGQRALTAFVRQAQLTWSGPSRARLELTVRNETSRPVVEVDLSVCVSCVERGALVPMTHRARRPVAPGEEAVWNVAVPVDGRLLGLVPRVDGPTPVYCTRLAHPDGNAVYSFGGTADLRPTSARSAVLESRLREIGWPGQHLRPRVDR